MLPKQTSLKVLQISMDKINGIMNFPKCFLKVLSFAVWLRELQQGLCDRLQDGWGGRWEGGQGGRGHGSNSGWFLLLYDRKPQNSVKQLKKKIASIKTIDLKCIQF